MFLTFRNAGSKREDGESALYGVLRRNDRPVAAAGHNGEAVLRLGVQT